MLTGLSQLPFFLAAAIILAAQLAEAQGSASGVFTGRSGKPMAKARIALCEIVGDNEVTYAKVRVLASVAPVTTDDQGRFQLKGFAPGRVAIIYQPGPAGSLPKELNIKPFMAVTKSIAPMLKNTELGKNDPFPERVWGTYKLLKGHTFMSEGANMKVWNASARLSPSGPYIEVRRGLIWEAKLADKSQLTLDAWSY